MAVRWDAEPAPEPRLLALDEDAGPRAGARPRLAARARRPRACCSASDLPDGAAPVAQAYAGHQFGGLSPRLGDGRALLLGELTDPAGTLRDLALKGSGRTPFARGGDGLAAVGPMLREHVVSRAMHALGIPTTRSLAVVATGRRVRRETWLPGRGARAGRRQPPAGGQLPARRRSPATSSCCAAWPTTRPPATTRRPPRPSGPTWPCSRRSSRPRRAGGPVDARRLRPRGHEHRQHDGLRRDHRLRPLRVHGGLRPGDGVQLHRHRRPLRLRQPARRGRVEPRPPRRGPAAAAGPGHRAGRGPGHRGARGLRPALRRRPSAPACGPSSGSSSAWATRSSTRWSGDLLPLLQAGRADHTAFFRSLGPGGARRPAARPRPCSRTPRASRGGSPAGGPRPRTAAWPSGSTRVYVPRNALVEEALAAATDGDLAPFERLLAVVCRTRSSSGRGSSATPPRDRSTPATGRSAAPDAPGPVVRR